MLSDTDTDQGDEHRAERREAREVGDEIGQDPMQAFKAQQIDGCDRCARRWVLDGYAKLRGDERGDDDDQG